MDPDLRAALFDGEDADGEFEELQDDFLIQVLYRYIVTIIIIELETNWCMISVCQNQPAQLTLTSMHT